MTGNLRHACSEGNAPHGTTHFPCIFSSPAIYSQTLSYSLHTVPQRYVDMIVSEETRATFRARSRIVSTIRRHLEDDGFLEVSGEAV